jgi:hypothetical protein
MRTLPSPSHPGERGFSIGIEDVTPSQRLAERVDGLCTQGTRCRFTQAASTTSSRGFCVLPCNPGGINHKQ